MSDYFREVATALDKFSPESLSVLAKGADLEDPRAVLCIDNMLKTRDMSLVAVVTANAIVNGN